MTKTVNKYRVEVTAVVLHMEEEGLPTRIALTDLGEGLYALPTVDLEPTEEEQDAVKRAVVDYVADESNIVSTFHSNTYAGVNRVEDERVIALLNVVNFIPGEMAKTDPEKQNATMFKATSEESKVILSTETETVILYRDGRVMGDMDLAKDHATMLLALF